jgi:hypothetical protein
MNYEEEERFVLFTFRSLFLDGKLLKIVYGLCIILKKILETSLMLMYSSFAFARIMHGWSKRTLCTKLAKERKMKIGISPKNYKLCSRYIKSFRVTAAYLFPASFIQLAITRAQLFRERKRRKIIVISSIWRKLLSSLKIPSS